MQNRPLFLKIISGVIIFGAWEIGGRSGVSFAFPPFSESMAAFLSLVMMGQCLKLMQKR